MNKSSTTILYLLIFAISTIFMSLSQRFIKQENGTKKQFFNLFWFVCSFIPLWLISCFTRIGADYDSYSSIINQAAIYRKDNGIVEWLFYTGCNILQGIFHNANIVIFIIKSITLLLFFKALYMIRKKAILWIALLAFCGLRFLEFYLIQMELAISIFALSIIYLSENKYNKFLLSYIVCILIHSSAIIILPVFILYFIFKCNKYLLSKKKIFSLLLICLIVMTCWYAITIFAITYIPFFIQYGAYGLMGDYSGSGSAIYIFYIPILYFCIQIYKNQKNLIPFVNLSIILSIFCFLFGILSYKIEVFGRIGAYSIIIQMLIIPTYLYHRHTSDRKQIINPCFEIICWILFLMAQSGLYIAQKIDSETSLVSEWSFFNPF